MDLTTLIFFALAVFVAWRLRSVLGQKTGHEQPPRDVFQKRQAPAPGEQEADGNVIRLPGAAANDATGSPGWRWEGVAEPGSAVAAGLDAIAREERDFSAQEFLEGAKAAYEMIVVSFAKGDRKTLKGLLSKDVYEDFDSAISERERKREVAETTFVSLDRAEIVSVDVKGRSAQIAVRLQPKLITAVRSAAGDIVDGSPDTIVDVVEVWTFARQLGSRDPTWLLVATEAGS